MPIYAERPLQTLMMPASSSRPKRKSRGDAYLEDNGIGMGGGGGKKEKENSAPAAKKRREEDKQSSKSTATTATATSTSVTGSTATATKPKSPPAIGGGRRRGTAAIRSCCDFFLCF
ncbi:hypothetical protein C7212DRAFT_345089 [Tuber magnatum]|uniref:Uncharacterized protein n=1 Tax=Tuber magnatum TaxID=42249 RepID=A0A317SV50_9PEZI|nr:hypothetical protein C7212DRAFT_345089 [Tuber magnatum]